MAQETEPLLQTYWLPKTTAEEAMGAFAAWIMFAVITALIILGNIVFTP